MSLFVKPFAKHKKLKKTFLKLIKNLPVIPGQRIYNSDWFLPENHHREYLKLFYSNIREHMNNLCDELQCQRWEIHNTWFQQYKKTDQHDWHNHSKTQFSNVYFLELPDKNMKTEFSDKRQLDVIEGDIITFPAYLIHRSKPYF